MVGPVAATGSAAVHAAHGGATADVAPGSTLAVAADESDDNHTQDVRDDVAVAIAAGGHAKDAVANANNALAVADQALKRMEILLGMPPWGNSLFSD